MCWKTISSKPGWGLLLKGSIFLPREVYYLASVRNWWLIHLWDRLGKLRSSQLMVRGLSKMKKLQMGSPAQAQNAPITQFYVIYDKRGPLHAWFNICQSDEKARNCVLLNNLSISGERFTIYLVKEFYVKSCGKHTGNRPDTHRISIGLAAAGRSSRGPAPLDCLSHSWGWLRRCRDRRRIVPCISARSTRSLCL